MGCPCRPSQYSFAPGKSASGREIELRPTSASCVLKGVVCHPGARWSRGGGWQAGQLAENKRDPGVIDDSPREQQTILGKAVQPA